VPLPRKMRFLLLDRIYQPSSHSLRPDSAPVTYYWLSYVLLFLFLFVFLVNLLLKCVHVAFTDTLGLYAGLSTLSSKMG
jgi:hypothetical protein